MHKEYINNTNITNNTNVTNDIDFSVFINSHKNIANFINKIYRIENMLNNTEIRYLYLASIISAESMTDEKTVEKCLNELLFLKDNIDYMNLSDELKTELQKFIKSGIKIAKRDLKYYKENNRQEK